MSLGRFVYKAIVKSQTQYLVTDHQALVLRQGEIYEHQDITGVIPEITGWSRNRIVTFGDALESTLTGFGRYWTPGGNLGMPTRRFNVRRGDGSDFPIRFYDLDAGEGERLVGILKGNVHRPVVELDGEAPSQVLSKESDSARESKHGDALEETPDTKGAFTEWAEASPRRFIVLPTALATAFSFGWAALTHSLGRGLFPTLVVGVGSYLAYRRRFGKVHKR